ncbi:NAD(P)H-binding protein [Rubrobacter marinus]|uniref:NAD(P)H-binding protein n=1 Tax=Rubrobacter marinus TaxID=2653852 RepID=A0A6G8Q0Z1_9ACTN|nr:NAD(P)H-binding protein [Rubrobacter marinus]QIN80136.1 NAD(P)H-binding protein [Rubrobacter marinus]
MYLITGATGNIGRSVVEQLHAEGHDVRALVRSASRAELLPDGIDIAVGDLDDAGSVAAALDGVGGVFLLHAGEGTSQTQIMIDAAHSTGVNRIVLLSSIGARLRPLPIIGATLAAREDLLVESGLDVTYLRPSGLSSNALRWAEGVREHNRVVDATDPGRVPVVDPDDVARVAALVLTEDGHVGDGYILNGPEALTSREQVGILSDVLERSIDFVDVTPEQLAQDSIKDGTPVQAAEAMQNLNELFRAGRAGVIADDVENLTGVAPRTFRDWCERHADAFR